MEIFGRVNFGGRKILVFEFRKLYGSHSHISKFSSQNRHDLSLVDMGDKKNRRPLFVNNIGWGFFFTTGAELVSY